MTGESICCDDHGTCAAITACCHIGGVPLQSIFFIPADDRFPLQAWCDECESARLQDRGWYDQADAVANWRWICEWCFVQAKVLAKDVIQVANPTTTPKHRPASLTR